MQISKKKTKPRKPCRILAVLLLSLFIGSSAIAQSLPNQLIGSGFSPNQALTLSRLFSGNNLEFEGTTYTLTSDDADAADTATVTICAGGAANADRGACTSLVGNEAATNPADAYLESGSASTGDVFVRVNSTNGLIRFATNAGVEVWNMNAAGTLIQNATNGGDVEFQKAATGVRYPAAAVLTPAADLTPVAGGSITTVLSRVVTGAPTASYIVLPAATANVGKSYVVANEDSDPINFLPAGANTLCGRAAATPCACAGNSMCTCTAVTTSAWACK